MDAVATALQESAQRLKETNQAICKGGSEIQRFYEDAVVFVTGGNGFMGKLLIEKLLRSCSVKKIYVLLRGKKGKTVLERLNDMKEDSVFDVLREMKPGFEDKIHPIEGDVSAIRLGICDSDWNILIHEVDTIFHLAATTRFDSPLPEATFINIRGTREVLTLAKQCIKLKVIVHVSTAYCHATTDKVGITLEEQFHTCPVPPHALIDLAEKVDASRMEDITSRLIRGWPNTYTFTKAVAEELVRESAEELPICVIRPPIVVSTNYEPTAGWLDLSCIYGPSGIITGTALGITRVCWTKRDVMLCFMPGDYVNNTILAGAWDCVRKREEGDRNIRIYTISSTKCNARYSTISDAVNKKVVRNRSTPKALWYCYLIEVENYFVYRILTWPLHYIPAYILYAVCYIFNISKPKGLESLVKLYKKIDKMAAAFQYFLTNDWCFDDKNVLELHQKMSPHDKTIFNLDVTTINWENTVFIWCMGVKRFILKESTEVSDYGTKKQSIFKIANYVCFFVYLYVFYVVLSLLYNFLGLLF